MNKNVNIHEAKTNLSKLLVRVSLGDEIIISKSGKPMAKLVPYTKPKSKKRNLGNAKGIFKVDKFFFEPLPKDVLESFYS